MLNIVCLLSSLFFSSLVDSHLVERRQLQPSSSLTVSSFTYGYFSQIYPNGEAASSAKPTSTSAASTAPNDGVQPTTTSAAGAGTRPGGQIMGASQEEAFIASMCSPVNQTNQPDMNFPCNRLALYESPCVYGKSYEDLMNITGSNSPASSLRSPSDQLTCLCTEGGQGHNYWQSSFDCSECRRLHGASVENFEDYAPAPYVKAFSSAYCAQAPSSAAALLDYATIWTSTATIDLGTSTGGSDVLGSSTAISLYAPMAAIATSTSISTTSSSSPTGSGQSSQTGDGTKASPSSGANALAISKALAIGLFGIIWSL